jgi:hypothetical protein
MSSIAAGDGRRPDPDADCVSSIPETRTTDGSPTLHSNWGKFNPAGAATSPQTKASSTRGGNVQ